MTFLPQDALGNFLDPQLIIPDDESAKYVIRQAFYDTAEAVNVREISEYPLKEIVNGNLMFTSGNPLKYRTVFRKVFEVGAILAGATSTTAHSISGITEATHLYGTAVTSTGNFLPLPHASNTANASVELYADATNVYIVNGSGADDIDSAIIVFELVKEA